MNKVVCGAVITVGIIAAGVVGYCFYNKETKYNADKLLNTVMDEAATKINRMTK